jgi:hypothetical protein
MKRPSVTRWLLAGACGLSGLAGLVEHSSRFGLAAAERSQPVLVASAPSPYNPSTLVARSVAPVISPAPVSQGNQPPGMESAVIIMPSMPLSQAPTGLPGRTAPDMGAPVAGALESPVAPVADPAPQVMIPVTDAQPGSALPAAEAALQTGAPVGRPAPVVGEIAGSPQGFPRAEPTPGRRSFVDLTAAPCFAHAPDYAWISGQVEHSLTAKQWRLRYASVDEEDRFGGRVVLIENQHVSYLADGQYVRVRGHLVSPGEAGNNLYRIESFTVLHDANDAELAPARK